MKVNRFSNRIAIILLVLISILFTFNSINNKNSIEFIDNKSDNQLSRKLLSEEDAKTDDSLKNCSIPSIANFPYISVNYRKSVFMSIIYTLIIIYMFIGIAVLCDQYFVPSLEVICDKLKLESSVAGSTFMAAGSSAPELAASLIGLFIAKDDIGIGAVVGSAVFNIAFVISICALFAGSIVRIHRWPIVRDSFFYLISICALFFAMFDEKITLIESLMFLFIYMLYIAFMAYNKQIENKISNKCKYFLRSQNDESSSLVSYEPISVFNKSNQSGSNSSVSDIESVAINAEFKPIRVHDQQMDTNLRETEDLEKSNSLTIREKVWKFTVYPIYLICWLTIPDCRIEIKQKWFYITFIMSCVWISVFSYLLIWMITIIGFNLRIPDTVMGLVFVAAGVSIPDAISSLIVAKEGLGDMALTNAIASNVFDILICLGLPWFIKTAIVDPGSSVTVISRGLEYSTLSLLSTVVFFLALTHLNGWKLDRRYGIILMIWYFAFMIMASLYELNILGQLNPPMCLDFF